MNDVLYKGTYGKVSVNNPFDKIEKLMFGSIQKRPDNLMYLERVEGWVRKRFSLGEEDIVFISEVNSGIPGYPPLETVITFWGDVEVRYQFKIFKPVADVSEDDLPISWLKESLRDFGDGNCC